MKKYSKFHPNNPKAHKCNELGKNLDLESKNLGLPHTCSMILAYLTSLAQASVLICNDNYV